MTFRNLFQITIEYFYNINNQKCITSISPHSALKFLEEAEAVVKTEGQLLKLNFMSTLLELMTVVSSVNKDICSTYEFI